MDQIRLKAYGKVNIGLDVIGKKADGYHEVKMVMQTIGIYDEIHISRIFQPEIRIATNLSYVRIMRIT